jgi:hypothetical protein
MKTALNTCIVGAVLAAMLEVLYFLKLSQIAWGNLPRDRDLLHLTAMANALFAAVSTLELVLLGVFLIAFRSRSTGSESGNT